jgi:2-amino-4-hydroxy-6-hydroxymethyldihydropteridine diphosphokinase
MRSEVTAYIGLGANLGDARQTLREAVNNIAALPCCELIRQSSLYGTAPMDSSGPDYVNAVVEIRTTLTAPVLHGQLQVLETQAGRERPYRNAPRTLDLDVLLFGDACIQSAELTVPHPRMDLRAFVLVPLAEIAPHRVSEIQLRAVQVQPISRLL